MDSGALVILCYYVLSYYRSIFPEPYPQEAALPQNSFFIILVRMVSNCKCVGKNNSTRWVLETYQLCHLLPYYTNIVGNLYNDLSA